MTNAVGTCRIRDARSPIVATVTTGRKPRGTNTSSSISCGIPASATMITTRLPVGVSIAIVIPPGRGVSRSTSERRLDRRFDGQALLDGSARRQQRVRNKLQQIGGARIVGIHNDRRYYDNQLAFVFE